MAFNAEPSEKKFINSTLFFIPFSYDDSMDAFTRDLLTNENWKHANYRQYLAQYLLSYANTLATNPDMYRCYELENVSDLKLSYIENSPAYKESISLDNVRISIFGTGIGFMEFMINYHDLGIDEIRDFIYNFKKSYKYCVDSQYSYEDEGYEEAKKLARRHSLLNIASDLMPERYRKNLFFYITSYFKKECLCYTMLHYPQSAIDLSCLDSYAFHISNTYNSGFEYAPNNDTGAYMMDFTPFPFNKWAGSLSGLVNITCESNNSHVNSFTSDLRYDHLMRDYRFMYLMLLNQRYAATYYIGQIASVEKSEHKALNQKIIDLKTKYSYRIISDEMIHQTVYERMYKVLSIDTMFQDLEENNQQVLILHEEENESKQRMMSITLFAISILSIFSFLIDATSYFDIFKTSHSSLISLILLLIIIIIVIAYLIKSNRKK